MKTSATLKVSGRECGPSAGREARAGSNGSKRTCVMEQSGVHQIRLVGLLHADACGMGSIERGGSTRLREAHEVNATYLVRFPKFDHEGVGRSDMSTGLGGEGDRKSSPATEPDPSGRAERPDERILSEPKKKACRTGRQAELGAHTSQPTP